MLKCPLIFILLASSCFSCEKHESKCCDCLERAGDSDAFNYPILPGSEEWRNLQSHTEMVNVCQIPAKTLKSMCTFGLIETYYNYPLLFVVTAFNNTKEGMEQLFEEFNGAHELLNRNDAPYKLMIKYEHLNFADIDTNWSTLEIGKFEYMFAYMEFTLAYDPILKALTKDQQSQLVHIAVNTYNEKMKLHPSNWKTLTSFFLISNLLNELQYQPFLSFTEKQPIMLGFINGYMINLLELSMNEQTELVNIINDYLIDN